MAYNGTSNSSLYVTFFSGLSQFTAPYNNGSVTIPNELAQMGVVYAVITNGNDSATDDNTVAGPAILNFPTNVTVEIAMNSTNGSHLNSTNSALSGLASIGVGNTFFVLATTIVLSAFVL